MSDDNVQHGINEACRYFYNRYEHLEQVSTVFNRKEEVKLYLKDMNPLIMLGIGYLLAKGYLKYRGSQYYMVTPLGFSYYKSLLENGDIVL